MKQDLKQINKDLFKWFILLFIIHPSVYFFSLLIALGMQNLFSIMKIVLILAPLVICICVIIFISLKKKLMQLLSVIEAGDSVSEKDVSYVNLFPRKGMLLLFVGCSSGPLLTVIVGANNEIILSGIQGIYFFLTGLIQAGVVGGLFYYFSKIILFPLSDRIDYSPLTVFHKLLIPVLSTVIVMLIIASTGLYRINYSRIFEQLSGEMREKVKLNSLIIDSLFTEAVAELRGYALSREINSMDLPTMSAFLKKIHKNRGTRIEILFVANRAGNSPNSLGTIKNLKNRAYFKEVLNTGKPVFSDPLVNKATGRQIVVCALPVKTGTRITGIMGATILIDTIVDLLKKTSFSGAGRFMMINQKGKILFHQDHALIGQIIGRETSAAAIGDKLKGLQHLKDAPVEQLFSFFDKRKEVFSYKTFIPLTKNQLIYLVNKSYFIQLMNSIIIQMIFAIILLGVAISFILYSITRRFSVPIQNTLQVIYRLTEGDLTYESNDYLPDEFGTLLTSFARFRITLKGIIHQALDAAVQLSSSAEQLAATSQNLSESSQGQAASVEQATASIEEVSSSIEQINNNAGTQSELASITFESMDALKKNNETVVGFASEALEKAKNTTGQAKTGNALMQNTIAGMDNIDASTKEIADMVRLISDISDQVNLLALNASIEAARAGEHGKGFAVVAEEISKLADETASSAKGITDLVDSGLNEVNKGRHFVDSTSNALNTIISNIEETEKLVRNITDAFEEQALASEKVLGDTRRVKDMAEGISSSTGEQMQTNQEMAKTIEQINQNTQAEAAGAEEIASSAEEISAQAETLRGQMEFFKV